LLGEFLNRLNIGLLMPDDRVISAHFYSTQLFIPSQKENISSFESEGVFVLVVALSWNGWICRLEGGRPPHLFTDFFGMLTYSFYSRHGGLKVGSLCGGAFLSSLCPFWSSYCRI